jgi:hypothetical protein
MYSVKVWLASSVDLPSLNLKCCSVSKSYLLTKEINLSNMICSSIVEKTTHADKFVILNMSPFLKIGLILACLAVWDAETHCGFYSVL